MYLIIGFLIILFCVLKLHVEKKFSYWKNCDVPFPKPTFLVGNVGKAFLLRESVSDIFWDLYRKYDGYAYVGFYNFLTPAIVLRDPELINSVLIKNFDKFQDTLIRTSDPIATVNPFFTGGEQWKRLRHQIAPQLSAVKMKYIYVHIENVCKEMIDYIKETKASVELETFALKFTGDNVMSCAYGLKNKSFLNNLSVMLKVNKEFNRSIQVASTNHTIGFFFPTFSKIFKISYLGKQIPKLLTNTIKIGMDQRIKSKTVQKDYLDFLIDLKNNNDKSYLGHAVTVFIDGVETSATTFIYLLLEIACNNSVQETGAKEVVEVYKKHGSIYSSDAVKDLVYLENAVLETLRKHAVIKYLNRQCTKDCTLPHPKNPEKSVFIKKGTQVFVPSQAIHRDPKFYTNPKVFDPSRFNDKHALKKFFFGFGDGLRICPGQHFAITQLKMGVASILLHFSISLNSKTQFPLGKRVFHLTKAPVNTIWIDFSPRL